MFRAFPGKLDVQWFAEQHDRNAEHGDDDEVELQVALALEHVGVAGTDGLRLREQHHVNEEDQHRWGAGRRQFHVHVHCEVRNSLDLLK